MICTDRRGDIMLRIATNVKRVEGRLDTPCFVWQGTHSGNGRGGGYPRMKLNGRTVAVHRVVATHYYGFIPGHIQVDHRCRNRMCVRGDHLELTTHLQNQRRRANGL